jgi:hypothetical protein
MAIFSDAMNTDKSKIEKINNLVEDEDTVALVTGKDRKIEAFHGFKKFGGIHTHPELKIDCIIGSGASDQITKTKEITVPSMNAIWECTSVKELHNLKNPVTAPTATATMIVTCTGGWKQTAASGTES